jgi:tetratricopeptide (TPR) repeat protein
MAAPDLNSPKPEVRKGRPQPANAASTDGPTQRSRPVKSSLFGDGRTPWLGLMLGILVFGTYLPALNNDFVNYDDHSYVTENTHVQSGLTEAGIKWAFQSSDGGNWHPLTWMSHMLDCELYGMHPWGHHLTNVLLHTADTLLLFLVLRRMTGARWRSWLVAALFGLHPLHVQSVAWIAERKDVLSTLFWMLTLCSYTIYTGLAKTQPRQAALYYLSTLAFFAVGLMCKPMLVTLPAVLLLLDFWPLARCHVRDLGRLLAEKIPFLLLSIAASVVTYFVQKSGGAVTTFDKLALPGRLENALVAYARYLGKMFWPENLAVLYPLPKGWPVAVVLLSGFLLLFVSILAIKLWRRCPFLLVGWFWFLGTLVPVIGLVQVGEQSMADRYMYVPMIGLLIAIIWLTHGLCSRFNVRNHVQAAAAIAVLIPCLFLTRQQIGFWKNSETLFRHDLAVAGDNPTAHYKLGVALNEEGEADEALQHFQAVLDLHPDDIHALYAMGVILANKGQLDEATRLFQQTLKQNPDFAGSHYELGLMLGRQGRLDEAIGQYQEAIRINPGWFDAHNSLGIAYARSGRVDEAISQFQAAVNLEPENVGALYNLGLAFNSKGRLDDAIALFQKVLQLKPDFADAHNNLGLAYSRSGRLDAAVAQFQAALTINPNHARARQNLEAALRMKAGTVPNP